MIASTTNQPHHASHRSSSPFRGRTAVLIGALAILSAALGACGSSSSPTTSASTAPRTTAATPVVQNLTTLALDTAAADFTGVVLPVPSNPITNTATAQTLKIVSALVENNEDAAGKTVADHLEIVLGNTGTTDATNVEIFYTFSDPTAGSQENYYAKLPDDFTVPAGGRRLAHFDDTGAPDHFPVNKFSLYYTSTNALDVRITVSAKDAALQTFDLKKDAGGAEAAD